MALRLHKRRTLAVLAGAVSVALVASACGGDDGNGDNAADQGADSRGPITYVQGKDNSNLLGPMAEKWNAEHPDEKVTVKEQSDQADQQHDDLVQHFQAKDAGYDVVSVDVVWTAEFAAKGWRTSSPWTPTASSSRPSRPRRTTTRCTPHPRPPTARCSTTAPTS